MISAFVIPLILIPFSGAPFGQGVWGLKFHQTCRLDVGTSLPFPMFPFFTLFFISPILLLYFCPFRLFSFSSFLLFPLFPLILFSFASFLLFLFSPFLANISIPTNIYRQMAPLLVIPFFRTLCLRGSDDLDLYQLLHNSNSAFIHSNFDATLKFMLAKEVEIVAMFIVGSVKVQYIFRE